MWEKRAKIFIAEGASGLARNAAEFFDASSSLALTNLLLLHRQRTLDKSRLPIRRENYIPATAPLRRDLGHFSETLIDAGAPAEDIIAAGECMAYKLLEKQVIYDRKKVRLELHQLENEETGVRHTREVCAHPGAVLILPLLDDDRVILIRTYRYAVGKSLYELPAGTLEVGEEPMNCAGRELLEETGYLAGRLQPLMNFFTSPGILSEKMFAFAAYDLQSSRAAPEEGEDITVEPVSLKRAVEMIRTGEIQDGKTIAAILYHVSFKRGGR